MPSNRNSPSPSSALERTATIASSVALSLSDLPSVSFPKSGEGSSLSRLFPSRHLDAEPGSDLRAFMACEGENTFTKRKRLREAAFKSVAMCGYLRRKGIVIL